MSKKSFGEVELTYDEQKLLIDMLVAQQLTEMYHNLFREVAERFARANTRFWEHVRATRQLPKVEWQMKLSQDHKTIIIAPLSDKAIKERREKLEEK